MNPSAPVATKAAGQPNVTVSQGTTAGAMTAPKFDPELNSPVARARSFFGNHSATVLIAAGKFPASAAPRAARAAPNPNTVRTRAWPAAARLQTTIDAE